MGEREKGGKTALLWSGGKDAMLALEVLRADGAEVAALVTTVMEPAETVAMHGVPLALVEAQARALGLPLRVMHQPEGASNDEYEALLSATLAPLHADGVTAVAAGDLFLEDVRAYREALIERLSFTPRFPLWGRDTPTLARHFVEAGYRAVACSVDTTQLDAGFVGRDYDDAFLQDLPAGVDPCGERGAFHTFVHDGPPFSEAVPVAVGAAHGDGRMRTVRLRLAEAG